jgi:hypothetical protein
MKKARRCSRRPGSSPRDRARTRRARNRARNTGRTGSFGAAPTQDRLAEVRRIIGAVAIVLGGAVFSASRADAICGTPPIVTVIPSLAAEAPTNAHVWVTLPSSWRATGLCDPILGDAPCRADTFSIGVRRAPMLGHARPWLDASERETPRPRFLSKDALGANTVELTPAARLDASTLYEVHLRARDAASDDVVGVFRTGDFADDQPPSWQGTPTGRYDHPAVEPGKIILSECGEPIARFDGLDPHDDRTAARHLRFEVRVREKSEPEDMLRPPDAVMTAFTDGRQHFYVWLGSSDESSDDGLLPRDQHALSVSFVILDWAGNRSDARAFDL